MNKDAPKLSYVEHLAGEGTHRQFVDHKRGGVTLPPHSRPKNTQSFGLGSKRVYTAESVLQFLSTQPKNMCNLDLYTILLPLF